MARDNTPFLFVGNGQYANRGCEAIAKASIRLVREYYPGVPIINGNETGDFDQIDETEENVTHIRCSCMGAAYKRMSISERILDNIGIQLDISKAGKVVREWAPKSRAVLSMGGDLYGLSHGRRTLLQYLFLGQAALKSGKPFVIWGATIGNIDAAGRVKKVAIDHFKRCSLMLVRDPESVEYLAANGVTDNVRRVADPAFLIESVEPKIPLPIREPLEETIGFNLDRNYGAIGGLGSYRDMIDLGANCVEEIMRATGRSVLLVPHVVAYSADWNGNDTLFLTLVRERLAEKGLDVPILPSSLRYWEIKWVLGKLKAYVGSRWHSTVSSFSSAVPTVSVSFSEKGPALNKLLLGHERFALNCKDLTPQNLMDKLSLLLSEEDSVRKTLQAKLPEIKALAHSAGDHLKGLLSE